MAGGPRVGKTTFAKTLVTHELPMCSTDDVVLSDDWSSQSQIVLTWIEGTGPWIIEGVPVVRALRKWLEKHPTGTPCDELYWRNKARAERTAGQEALATGTATIFNAIRPELERRGVTITMF